MKFMNKRLIIAHGKYLYYVVNDNEINKQLSSHTVRESNTIN